MLLSYNWLKELLPDLKLNPQEVAGLLTSHSFETVIKKEFSLDPAITIVRIEKIEPHPNADKLRLATVTDGTNSIQVVCGAPNIEKGQIVPLAPPGAKVLDKDGQLFELSVAKIRGVESPGMLNSRRELGLGSDHDGIFVLPTNTLLGSKLTEHIPNDTVLEADITPNRAHDCLSHIGVAREIAALTNLQVKEPQAATLPKPETKAGAFSLRMQDNQVVPRYMAIAINDIHNTVSPLWLQAKLLMLEQKPINAVVDITNYVMFEGGNPNHIFDTQKLPGTIVGTRTSITDETITLLDSSERVLPEGTLLITADDKPIAIAGIMGGAIAEVGINTTEGLLEIANFHPFTIQKSVTQLGLRTEAAARFLKGIDPNQVDYTAKRLAHLLQEITHAKVAGVIEHGGARADIPAISFRPERVSRIAGTAISTKASAQALTKLRCKVIEESDTLWQITPPSDRLDITGEHDLIEEIIRLEGLVNIPSISVSNEEVGATLPHAVMVREALRNQLVANGFTENYSYSFEPAKEAKVAGIEGEEHLTLVNPIAPELHRLRTSLIPSLLAAFKKNKAEILRPSKRRERALFEIGHIYKPGDGGQVVGVIEEEHIAGICIGDPTAVVESILTTLNVPYSKEATQTHPMWGTAVAIKINNEVAGHVGLLATLVIVASKYPTALGAFTVNLTSLTAHTKAVSTTPTHLKDIQEVIEEPIQFTELHKYPSVFRDLAILVTTDVSTEHVQQLMERVGGELVIDTELFDEYEPDSDPSDSKGQKSLAFHLEYNAPERTLTQEEVNEIQEKITQALKTELNATVR